MKFKIQEDNQNVDYFGVPIPKPINTKKLLYNKNGETVYYITDVSDMIDVSSKKYGGVVGRWTVAGRTIGCLDRNNNTCSYDELDDLIEDGQLSVKQAESNFKHPSHPGFPINQDVDGYYIWISNNKEKYCIISYISSSNNRRINCWWDQDGNSRVSVGKLGLSSSIDSIVDLGGISPMEEIYYWNGEDKVPNNVVNVVVQDGVRTLDNQFTGKKYLESIKIPDSVHYFLGYEFRNCQSLKSITIPKEMTTIPLGVFQNCWFLKEVNILGTVNKIDSNTFYCCYNLHELIITNPHIVIDSKSFYRCDQLVLYYNGTRKDWENNIAYWSMIEQQIKGVECKNFMNHFQFF